MTDSTFSEPVAKLLTLGEVKNSEQWRNYRILGLGEDHIPELIALATDQKLNRAEQDSLEVWAPLHAWRALADLHAVEAIGPLVAQIDTLEYDDWFHLDLPLVLEQLGPSAIPPLNEYLRAHHADTKHVGYITAVESLQRIGRRYIEARGQCTAILLSHLMDYAKNDEGFNGCIINALLELRTREALPLIAAVYKADRVDPFYVDWEDVRKTYRLPPAVGPEDISETQQ